MTRRPAQTTMTDAPSRRHRILHFAVTIVFGLFYAYDLFEAISNLVAVPAQLADYNQFLIENDITPLPVPWTILIANLLLPVVVFAVAWVLGRGRSIRHQAILLLAGLALVAALTLTLTSLL
jgi:hypothetical protein